VVHARSRRPRPSFRQWNCTVERSIMLAALAPRFITGGNRQCGRAPVRAQIRAACASVSRYAGRGLAGAIHDRRGGIAQSSFDNREAVAPVGVGPASRTRIRRGMGFGTAASRPQRAVVPQAEIDGVTVSRARGSAFMQGMGMRGGAGRRRSAHPIRGRPRQRREWMPLRVFIDWETG
jgi:hypothetical protein